ncbi:MAG: hypothetical protein LWX56_10215 [Ignavibacteria bacterium]|nr:hypothetical protein [Ignavibacteria bacterium]
MSSYSIIVVLHIISALIWFSIIPADLVLRKYVLGKAGVSGQRKVISAWLQLLNLTGMAGMTGILITGIVMVLVMPGYGFFQVSSNHWLTFKQISTLAIIALTGAYIIPLGKKTRIAIGSNLENNDGLTEEAIDTLKKLVQLAEISGLLVGINLLFGLGHSVLQIF